MKASIQEGQILLQLFKSEDKLVDKNEVYAWASSQASHSGVDGVLLQLEAKRLVLQILGKTGKPYVKLTQPGWDTGRKLHQIEMEKLDVKLTERLLEQAINKEAFSHEEFNDMFKDMELDFEINSYKGFHRCRGMLHKYGLADTSIFSSNPEKKHKIILTELGKEVGTLIGFENYKNQIDQKTGRHLGGIPIAKDEIKKIKLLIADNQTEEAIKSMIILFERTHKDSPLEETIIISGWYQDIEEKERMNLAELDDISVEKSKISKALLDLIKTIRVA